MLVGRDAGQGSRRGGRGDGSAPQRTAILKDKDIPAINKIRSIDSPHCGSTLRLSAYIEPLPIRVARPGDQMPPEDYVLPPTNCRFLRERFPGLSTTSAGVFRAALPCGKCGDTCRVGAATADDLVEHLAAVGVHYLFHPGEADDLVAAAADFRSARERARRAGM